MERNHLKYKQIDADLHEIDSVLRASQRKPIGHWTKFVTSITIDLLNHFDGAMSQLDVKICVLKTAAFS